MLRTIAIGGFAIAAMSLPAHAQVKVKLEPYVTGVNAPLAMVQPAGDDRKFVIEQFGRVRVIDKDGKLEAEPFIDIRNKLPTLWSDFDERGLLGMAFHPDFANNGKFYLAYSTPINFQLDLAKEFWWDHTNVVAEYQVSGDANVADTSQTRIITTIDWPQFNHNGHWIGFGPDGMLYISTGDGGYANDWGIGHNVTEGNGQDNTQLQGKILRIDVNNPSDGKPYGIPDGNLAAGNPDIAPEIWATGFRNPWRCSFDMEDGRLFCGDVQQNSYEEVDIVEAGKNYGWRKMEADKCFDYVKPNDHPAECGDTSGFTPPVIVYNNCTAKPDGCKGISVTGGYVYRGSHDAWKGKYIFGDWSKSFAEMDGQIFVATEGSDGNWTMEVAEVVGMDGNIPYILAFAQDSAGEVYALTSITTGPVGSLDTIYKIVPAE